MSLLGFTVLIAVTFIVLLVVFLVNKVIGRIARRRGSLKTERFEAGNPPIGSARSKLIVQYFGYVYLIIALECIFLILLLLGISGLSLCYIVILMVTAVISALTLILALRYCAEVREWI